jgi:hypothetical protein
MSGPQDIWLLEGQHPGGPGRAWLRHSTDDGRTWQEVAPGRMPGYLDFYCRGGVIWVLGGSVDPPVVTSRDGGRTWEAADFQGLLIQAWRIAIPADHPVDGGYAVYVLGLAPDRTARLLRGDDGGRRWKALPLPAGLRENEFWNLGQMYFATTEKGRLGLAKGRLLTTDDGGRSWQERRVPTDRGFSALWFDALGRGFAAVNNHDIYHITDAVYGTLDGGRTWRVALGGYKQINSFCGLGTGQLWAVGTMPTVVPNDVVAILKPRGLEQAPGQEGPSPR